VQAVSIAGIVLNGRHACLVNAWIMKLLDQLALGCRRKGMAKSTVSAYGGWVDV
jgi:hypothetical protein